MSDSANTLEEPFLASNAQLRPQQSIRHVSANNGSTSVAVFTTGPVNLPNAVHPQGTNVLAIQGTKPSVIQTKIFLSDPQVDRERVITKKGERTPKTCEWIKGHELFKKWLTEKSDLSLLWISGGPGMGKTMLSVFLTFELERLFAATGDQVLYYFCSHDDAHESSAAAILRGLIFQLLQSREDLAPVVARHLPEEASAQHTRNVVTSFESLWIIFRALAACFDPSISLFCLVDGIDEYDQDTTGPLIDRLRRPGALGSNVKMLIVSRDIPALRGLTRLKLDPDNHASVQSDIGRFIAYEVAQLSQTHNLDPQFCTKIETDLLRRSEGTFLWVGFAMQELTRQSTSNQIQNALASLPHGLNSTYSRILMQIKESDRRQTALLLQLTAIAVRPLTIAELASLIGNDESPEVPAERATLDAIALCANILRRDDDQVTFVHLSAKEYLQKQLPILMNNQPGLRTFYISDEDAQLYLAEACVITIEGSSFQDNKLFESLDENSEDDATVSDNWSLANCNSDAETDSDDHEDLYQFEPLLEYATLYWFRHAAYLNTKSSQLYNLQRSFFGEHSVTRANWLRAYIYHRSYRGQSLSQDSNLLIVSARFNVLNLAMALLIDPRGSYISRWLTRLSRSFDSAQTATLNEALCVACAEGHRAFANALLQMGADPNGHGYTESTPLGAAASLGRTSIVQLLADNGLDTSQEEYLAYHRKAFCNAASQGNNRLVRLYLGEIPDEQKGRQQPGQPPNSDRLPPSGDQNQMKNAVDIDVKDTYGRTPLQLAAMYGHTGVVQFLLDKGANVEGALHMAVASNSVSIVRMVLSRHRDCNVFDEDHNTPLHLAVRIPSYDIVCCLLKHNANFLLRNRQNLTPLQVAATLGNAEAVALFFDRRPSNQVEDAIWIDAMGRAASRGYGNVVTVLLARRVPPDLKDGSGITALQNAASEGSEQVVKLLLNGGAAIDALDNSGETALFFATQYSRKAVVKTLLQYGADVTITNPEGWTALMFAIQGDDVGIQALLLSKGAVVSEEQRHLLQSMFADRLSTRLEVPGLGGIEDFVEQGV